MTQRTLFARCAALTAMALLLVACASKGGDDQGNDARGVALVTTAMPMQRRFHDSVQAWGSVVADPHRTRTISLAHGGHPSRPRGGRIGEAAR